MKLSWWTGISIKILQAECGFVTNACDHSTAAKTFLVREQLETIIVFIVDSYLQDPQY